MVKKKPISKRELIRRKAERIKKALPLVLGFKPNPCELEAVIRDADIADTYRYATCPGYSSCLGVACLGVWLGFSCRACDVYNHHCKHTNGTWTKRIRGINNDKSKRVVKKQISSQRSNRWRKTASNQRSDEKGTKESKSRV
jgi:hypothetical protein